MDDYNLNGPFYVFDNIHDWLNEINLGNGLATILCWCDEFSECKSDIWQPHEFVIRANKFLSVKTSIGEIRHLLRYHHPYYKCTDEVKNFVFQIDKKDIFACLIQS